MAMIPRDADPRVQATVHLRYGGRELTTTADAQVIGRGMPETRAAQAPGAARQVIAAAGGDAVMMLAAVTGDVDEAAAERVEGAIERVRAFLAAWASVVGGRAIVQTIDDEEGMTLLLQADDLRVMLEAL